MTTSHDPGRLTIVVSGVRMPGVYRWRSTAHRAAVCRDLAIEHWGCHILDGRRVTGASSLFDEWATVLRFPVWFGRNYDSFFDCLADLSWLPRPGHVVLWDHAGVLIRRDPWAWQSARVVLADVTRRRVETGMAPLYVLLRGVPEGSDIPFL